MNKSVFLVIFSILSLFSFSQDEWTLIHPYPTLNNLIDVHFVSDNEGWLVGTKGTILYTDDGGDTWETQHSNPDESLWSVFFIDDNEGWVCGWSEIYHTEDAGQNWSIQDAPFCMGDFTDVFFINPDTGWIVGTYKIVLKTTDGGENWIKIQNSIADGKCFKRVAFYDDLHGCAVGDVMMGGNEGFIMVTDDGGLSWTETTPANSDWLTDVEYYNSMCIWTCGYDGNVFRSLDGGHTWYEEYYGSESFDAIHFFNDSNGILIAGNSALLSFDGGDNWDSLVYITQDFTSFHAFMSWENNKGMLVGYGGTISRTMDGGSSWEKINKGLNVYFSELGFFDSFNGLGIGGVWSTAQLLRTYDGGYNWEYDTIIPNGRFYNLYMDGQSCYLLNDSSQMMKTHDGGLNWELLDIISPDSYYSDFQFVNENTGYCCGYKGEFIKTINGGLSWEDMSFGSTFHLSKVFFADDLHGWLINYDAKEILRTSNGGETWASSQLGSTMIYQPVSIFFHDVNAGYVTTDDGLLYKSIDGGASWELLYGFPSGNQSKIYFVSETEGWYMWASRVYHTHDGGITWSDGERLGSYARSIFFLSEDQGWIGGSSGMIVTYDGIVGISESISEDQNILIFPNPTQRVLFVQVLDGSNADITISVYNMEGKIVLQSIENGDTNPVSLDVSQLPAGTYLLQTTSTENQQILKFVKH
ncbi:MAG: T9SS type A sorting domain-containing protein [Bacteroidales bacterium]|nr:T9SS type A sorting domain-containing protein [Bacteroidales bacterium]